MFVARKGNVIISYESGAFPTWRVRRSAMTINYMKNDGYSPWRYRKMDEPKAVYQEPLDDIKLCRPGDRL
jgi:hypothetical protein